MSAAEPLTAVLKYIAAFNDGDETAMSSLFATDGVIVDGVAPHVRLGPSAATDRYRDVLVLPATMRFTLEGVPVTQTGARFTVALRRLSAGWRVAAWAWTKGLQSQ